MNQVLEKCGSTNDVAKTLAEQGAPHGSWISTKVQESGRGRLGRPWESLEGNLFLSLVIRKVEMSLWSWVPLTTAVGVIRYLNHKFPHLEARIKWPNDLYLNQKKFGGILCESVGGAHPFIIVGMGLNCTHSPSQPEMNATDLSSHLKPLKITADDIRTELIFAILNEIQELSSNGPKAISIAYEKWAVLAPNLRVGWGQGRHSGTVSGLGPSGELEILTDDGHLLNLYAEEVSLDKPIQSLPLT